MNALTKIQKTRISLVLIAGLLFLGYTLAAPRQIVIEGKVGNWLGTASGKWDASRGHFRFIEYGYAAPNFTASIRKRHNIEVKFDDRGCVVTTYERSYASAYNALMKRKLQERLGVDVIEEAEQEQQRQFYPQ